MNEELKISKWAAGIGITILLAIGGQTFFAARWAGQVSERLDAVSASQQTVKREVMDSLAATENRLNRRIERLEDFDRQRKLN